MDYYETQRIIDSVKSSMQKCDEILKNSPRLTPDQILKQEAFTFSDPFSNYQTPKQQPIENPSYFQVKQNFLLDSDQGNTPQYYNNDYLSDFSKKSTTSNIVQTEDDFKKLEQEFEKQPNEQRENVPHSCVFKEKTLIFLNNTDIIQQRIETYQEIEQRKTRIELGTYNNKFEDKYKLSLENFNLLKLLGSGKFSDVYIAKEKRTGFLVALKQIKFSTIKEYNLYQDITNEIILQSKLQHKNIIKLYGFFIANQSLYLIQELSYGKDLFTDMKAQHNKSYNESIVSLYIRQVTDALHYMHMSNIVHRDIKPENIMICDGVLKLCDFGYAAPFSKQVRRSTFCGTLDYVSPEMIENKLYNNSVDIWSLGVLTYELIFGRAPFAGKNYEDTFQNVLKGHISFIGPVSFECGDFITRLLTQDPNKRMKLAQALRHPFLQNIKNEMISVDKNIVQSDFDFLL